MENAPVPSPRLLLRGPSPPPAARPKSVLHEEPDAKWRSSDFGCLPRSGSTLLAAILRQNPQFYAGMSSPVASLFMALQSAMSRRNEAALFIDEDQKRELLKGTFENYYHAIQRNKVIFDTNRAWLFEAANTGEVVPGSEGRMLCSLCAVDHGQHRASDPRQCFRIVGHIRI